MSSTDCDTSYTCPPTLNLTVLSDVMNTVRAVENVEDWLKCDYESGRRRWIVNEPC